MNSPKTSVLSQDLKNKVPYLPNLQALRGFAALMVVIYHFDSIVMSLTFTHGSAIIHKAYLMVDLFFILSGFIMLHVYGDSFSVKLKWHNYWQFLKARFARIYPLHLFTLLILIIIFYTSLNSYMSGDLSYLMHDAKAIPAHLLLIQSFGLQSIFTWNITSWSISAEWWAYVLFPFLALMLSKRKNLGLFILVVAVIAIYISIVYYLPRSKFIWNLPNTNDLNVSYEWGFLRGIAGFMTGMICYPFYQNKKLNIFFAKDYSCLFAIILIAFAFSIQLNHLAYIPLFMLLLLCFASNNQTIQKVIMFKLFQYLGKISYSMYMLHYLLILCVLLPMLDLMRFKYTGPGSLHPPLNIGIFLCLMFILVVILFSSLSYDFIEKPCRSWLNKLRNKRTQI